MKSFIEKILTVEDFEENRTKQKRNQKIVSDLSFVFCNLVENVRKRVFDVSLQIVQLLACGKWC